MPKQLTYDKNVVPMALLEELVAAGVAVHTVEDLGEQAVVTVDDAADEQAVDALVEAHDPVAIEEDVQAKKHTYDDAVAFLQTYYKTANAQITVDQSKNAIRALTILARTQHQALAIDEG